MIARTIDKFRPGDDDWRTLASKGEGDLLGRCLTTLVGIAGGQGLAFISRWTIDGAQDAGAANVQDARTTGRRIQHMPRSFYM